MPRFRQADGELGERSTEVLPHTSFITRKDDLLLSEVAAGVPLASGLLEIPCVVVGVRRDEVNAKRRMHTSSPKMCPTPLHILLAEARKICDREQRHFEAAIVLL